MRRALAAGLIVFGLGAGVARAAPRPVAVQLSRDTTTAWGAQHPTQVEPSSAAWRSVVVAAFQSGRFSDGGAAAIGWATSVDGGSHWRNGMLAPDPYERVSDPVVVYDAAHNWWLIAALGSGPQTLDIVVSRSRDGVAWFPWERAASDFAENYDKEWLACDNSGLSPFRGRCYLAYVDYPSFRLGLRTSLDGGRTWSAVTDIQPGEARGTFSGPVPVVRPDGSVVVPFTSFGTINGVDQLKAVRSLDGGATWSTPYVIAGLADEELMDVRAPALPSAAGDSAGRVYLVWQDDRYRNSTGANDIVLSSSPDGVTWRPPLRLPLPVKGDPNYFLPAVGADPATPRHIAVLYHSIGLPAACALFVPGCEPRVDVWIMESRDAGVTWGSATRLNGESMRLPWLADTSIGRMLGDYVSVSFTRGRAVPVFALASPTQGESIYAGARG